METSSKPNPGFNTSVSPWLTAPRGAQALEFYKQAFNATEVYRLDGPDESVVAKLSINGAEFWVSAESANPDDLGPESVDIPSIRIILTVSDPDAVFAQAIEAGASEVYPVSDEHGWRLGRIMDPFGHHWEIGRQMAT